jgi:hypothetical protein
MHSYKEKINVLRKPHGFWTMGNSVSFTTSCVRVKGCFPLRPVNGLQFTRKAGHGLAEARFEKAGTGLTQGHSPGRSQSVPIRVIPWLKSFMLFMDFMVLILSGGLQRLTVMRRGLMRARRWLKGASRWLIVARRGQRKYPQNRISSPESTKSHIFQISLLPKSRRAV